jgi:hypothetical protein
MDHDIVCALLCHVFLPWCAALSQAQSNSTNDH